MEEKTLKMSAKVIASLYLLKHEIIREEPHNNPDVEVLKILNYTLRVQAYNRGKDMSKSGARVKKL